ncbi:MAG: hypothetical protein N2V75_09790 [Methanophagales archaeon]|nr:hypothetical protein [Methanophagales archaeon]
MSKENPFSPAFPVNPKYFVNRIEIIDSFKRAFDRSTKTETPTPDNIAILGDWGIGKTSVLNATTEDVQAWKSYRGMNYTAKLLALEQELHRGFQAPKNPVLFRWTPPFISPVSYVKVFEYVKGARIEGRAPDGSIVAIVTNVTTNQGREFIYSQTTISNGSYKFIVPYSTTGPVEGGTDYDVLATTYKIRAGHTENETIVWDIGKGVEVDEREVLEGKTVWVDLFADLY